MTSRRRRNYTAKAVSEVGKFSGIACSIISRLVVEIFMRKNSIITKSCHLVLGVPLIMPHRVHTNKQACWFHGEICSVVGYSEFLCFADCDGNIWLWKAIWHNLVLWWPAAEQHRERSASGKCKYSSFCGLHLWLGDRLWYLFVGIQTTKLE